MKRIAALSIALAVSATVHGQAMKDMPMKDHKAMDMKMEKKGAGSEHTATGKVTRIDQSKGTVTIAHGPVAGLNWPAMTMAFKVKDKNMLDKMRQGENVEFSFTSSGRDHIITKIK